MNNKGRPFKLIINGFSNCSRCKLKKPIDDYHKQIGNHNGISYNCKDCRRQYSKDWYIKNSDAKAAWYKKYLNNPMIRLEYRKKWRMKAKRRYYEQKNSQNNII